MHTHKPRAQRTPERRWWARWERAYRTNNGFAGTATMQAQRTNALRYFRAGATAEAAGLMCAEQYHLHSSRDTDREWAAGMSEDIQDCLRTHGGNLDYLQRVYGRIGTTALAKAGGESE